MKKFILILVLFCTSLAFAQEQPKKVTLKKQGAITEATYFDTHGNIEQHGFFKHNKRHGNWISYNEKGEEMVVGYYKEGKKTGKWVFKTDNLLKEVDYLDNEIIDVNQWTNKSIVVNN